MEEAGKAEGHDQAGEDDGDGGAELDQDVQGRTGGILEGIAHGIADDSCFVVVTALSAEVSFFDVLFRVVPGTAGVGHEDCHGEAGDRDAAQQTDHAFTAEDQSGGDGDHDGEKGGDDHLLQSALGADGDAGSVVGICGAFHDALDLTELPADFHHDMLRGVLDCAHGVCRKDKGQHGADKQTDKDQRVRERKIHGRFACRGELRICNGDVGDQKGESKVSAVFYGLDGKKKTTKAVKAKVALADGLSAVRDVALVVKGEAAPFVVTVTADGSASGTFGTYIMERVASVGSLAPAARIRVAGLPAAIDGTAILGDVECDGRSYHLLPDGEGVAFSAAGTKWIFAKSANVKYAKSNATGQKELFVDIGKDGSRTNLCGLRLSVNAKTGVFKGGFTVYADAGTPERPKLKKFKFKVSGVVVDGVGAGRASYKSVVANVVL